MRRSCEIRRVVILSPCVTEMSFCVTPSDMKPCLCIAFYNLQVTTYVLIRWCWSTCIQPAVIRRSGRMRKISCLTGLWKHGRTARRRLQRKRNMIDVVITMSPVSDRPPLRKNDQQRRLSASANVDASARDSADDCLLSTWRRWCVVATSIERQGSQASTCRRAIMPSCWDRNHSKFPSDRDRNINFSDYFDSPQSWWQTLIIHSEFNQN